MSQFARKLSVDYALGKLVYVLPSDRDTDPDAKDCLPKEAPNCHLQDAAFIKSLRNFLRTPENWNRLRLFMLRAGWPADLLEDSKQATGAQRLKIAKKFLTKMLSKKS